MNCSRCRAATFIRVNGACVFAAVALGVFAVGHLQAAENFLPSRLPRMRISSMVWPRSLT